MSEERRRSSRVEILGRLRGEILEETARPVTVRELSLGGLSLEAEAAFEVGSLHDFRLTLGDGAAVMLRGRVVYSRASPRPGGGPVFVTGVQFVDEDEEPGGDAGLTDLMGRIR